MARYKGGAIGLYNQALCNRVCQSPLRDNKSRRILDPVYFDSLRVETLDDCASVGGDGIGRGVIELQLVFTDLQDDDPCPAGPRNPGGCTTPVAVSPLMPWFVTVTWWPLALNAAFQLSQVV
jgi:hypothetical protein